ncbi:hypothetical protein TrCOL_g9039 [Triparma columacea]|uniref:Glycine-rich domain-containing protein-like n=1 Tax=Triparma columacea TaxID=722753 RepID=A0A9W7GSF0_9STRA|nr:hypothetical protein TrCOL_g9039 [Triparma columacea]
MNQAMEFEDFLKQFDKDSFSPILSKCTRHNDWDQTYASQVLDEYAKFFYLASLPNRVPLVPSPAVDEIWHQHILTTKKYQEDCGRLVGHFVHHCPSFTAEERAGLAPKFEKTKAAYENKFGEMPENIWAGDKANCNKRCDDGCGCAD